MNINGQLPKPDFSCFTAPRQKAPEKRGRTTPPVEIKPQDQALDESPTKRLRQQDKNSLESLLGVMSGVFLSPTKKEASQNQRIAQLSDQIAKLVHLPAYKTHAIADAIIFAFSPKEVEGTYYEPKDNIVPLSILYDFDARQAYVDLEEPIPQAAYQDSRLALQVTVPANKAEATVVKKFQLVPCATRPYEKKVLAKAAFAQGAYIPCEAYFIPHKNLAIPTRYAMFPLFSRKLTAFNGQANLPKDIVTTTYSALNALSKLHAADVIHGNVCINSIHIDEAGSAKFTDFSCANTNAVLWQLYGAAKHTAPEFFAEDQPADPLKFAQDVYAIARVIREVLTNEPLPWDQKMQDLQQLYRKYNATVYTANEDMNDIVKIFGEIGNLKTAILKEQNKLGQDSVAAIKILATSEPKTLKDYAILKLVSQAAMHPDPNKRPTAQALAAAVYRFIA